MTNWVRDEPNTREKEGKRLLVQSKDGKSGVFLMRVHEATPEGERKPGHVILTLEPYDLDAGLNMDAIYAALDKSMSPAP